MQASPPRIPRTYLDPLESGAKDLLHPRRKVGHLARKVARPVRVLHRRQNAQAAVRRPAIAGVPQPRVLSISKHDMLPGARVGFEVTPVELDLVVRLGEVGLIGRGDAEICEERRNLCSTERDS